MTFTLIPTRKVGQRSNSSFIAWNNFLWPDLPTVWLALPHVQPPSSSTLPGAYKCFMDEVLFYRNFGLEFLTHWTHWDARCQCRVSIVVTNVLRWNWQMGMRQWPATLWSGPVIMVGVPWEMVRIAAKRWNSIYWNLKGYLLCWTELGVLQLPLLSRGCFPQQEIDGRPHGYSVFKRVRRMMVVVMESKHDSLFLEEKEL